MFEIQYSHYIAEQQTNQRSISSELIMEEGIEEIMEKKWKVLYSKKKIVEDDADRIITMIGPSPLQIRIF